MALTLVLLEQIMQSEVENLHARIDAHGTLIDRLFDRLDSIDRQLSLLWLAVEDLKFDRVTAQSLEAALANYATKSDLTDALASYATKADLGAALAGYATKADVQAIVDAALMNYPTKADLQAIVETTIASAFAKYFPAPGA